MKQEKICAICTKHFNKKPSQSKEIWKVTRYCSRQCSGKAKRGIYPKGLIPFKLKPGQILSQDTQFKKGVDTWNKGKSGYMSDIGRRSISEAMKKRHETESPEHRTERLRRATEARLKRGYDTPKTPSGKESPLWLDESASYSSKHKWIQKHWIKTNVCQICGDKPVPHGRKKHGTEWASLNHTYLRNEKDAWLELCISCHRKLDNKLITLGE